jgi:hypothetical protein
MTLDPSAPMPGGPITWSPDPDQPKRDAEEATTLARANFARAVEYLKVDVNYLSSLKDMITATYPFPGSAQERKPYPHSPQEVSEALRAVSSRLAVVAQASGTYLR